MNYEYKYNKYKNKYNKLKYGGVDIFDYLNIDKLLDDLSLKYNYIVKEMERLNNTLQTETQNIINYKQVLTNYNTIIHI